MGVSRAALARRFTAPVGGPPTSCLAGRRIALAATLLRETGHTVSALARKVGYADVFALGVAFKWLRGTRPSDHRGPGAAGRAGWDPSAAPPPRLADRPVGSCRAVRPSSSAGTPSPPRTSGSRRPSRRPGRGSRR
ncbi:helix-turn-helix domain-containing protein [Streptomyces sp. NPDC085946]|uniref:helix-turn-helix domain-containing protein n=1 Tax=Streptomyces sp. NPDC085946 TaxID=3365744 RepID=UPI0037CF0D4E